MLESTRSRVLSLPRSSSQWLLSVGTLGSFTWLLVQDKIHPIVIYLLQVYLTF